MTADQEIRWTIGNLLIENIVLRDQVRKMKEEANGCKVADAEDGD
jgi:hypothetical protein